MPIDEQHSTLGVSNTNNIGESFYAFIDAKLKPTSHSEELQFPALFLLPFHLSADDYDMLSVLSNGFGIAEVVHRRACAATSAAEGIRKLYLWLMKGLSHGN